MGKKQRDCAGCGAPVGFIGREYCCLCMRRIREQAAKSPCPGCGKARVLDGDTGRCVLCSRRCSQSGGPVRSAEAVLCRRCRRRAAAAAAKSLCPRCGRPGLLREDTGWCGTCSRPHPGKAPPRVCRVCGQLRRHAALGMCNRCFEADPDRPLVRGEHLIAQLEAPPSWLGEFVDFIAVRYAPSRAAELIGNLGQLLREEHPNHPQALLERARRPGRSIGPLARGLEQFFTERHLALPTDHAHRLAASRRDRRVNAAPVELRPAVAAFAAVILDNRDRARRAGTKPRTDHTIDAALATVRDLAQCLASRGKLDWALVDVHDIEAFLGAAPKSRARRLTVLRQFFRTARSRKVVLVDPTRGLSAKQAKGFTGRTLRLDEQRALFRRWTSQDPHPHEALLGLLALLHGAASHEVRRLRCDDIDTPSRTVRLGRRPGPVPLDPASWTMLQRCLQHRQGQRTENPHLIVTKGTKAGTGPASSAYFTHLLDPAGVPPRAVRCSRLAELVNTMDPKLVAAAFGMSPERATAYLSDHVDETRLPPIATNP